MFIFGLCSTSDDWLSNPAKNVDQNTKKWKRPPKLKNKMFVFGFNFWWLARSEQKMLTETLKNKKGPLSYQKIKCSFLDYIQLLMIGWAIQQKTSTKKWKIPLIAKNCLFWITFNFWWSAKQSEQKMLTKTQKNEKGPLSHQKIKCSFLDYVQLLMIGQVIWAKNVDRNVKKQKRPPKLSKNKMFIFRLCSTSDDRLSHPSKKRRPKCKTMKKAPKSHQKIKCSFLDYIQLLMIGWAIWAKNIDRNAKKQKRPPKSSKNKMFIFWLCSTSDDRPINLSKKCWPKCKKMKKAP